MKEILEYDYARNRALLMKCNRIYGVLFFYFILSSILLLLYSFLNLVCIGVDANLIMKAGAEPLAPNYLLLLIDAAVIAPMMIVFGLMITQRHHDLSAFFAAFFTTANLVLFIVKRNWAFFDRVPISFWVFVLYSFLGLTAAVIGFHTNIIFHKIELLPGYPQFNERLDEQNIKIDQFQCEYNRLKRTSSDKMEELPTPQINEHNNE